MRSSVATAILILLVCFPISASAKELTAQVVDQNGQPIEAVSVITNVEGLGTKTDSSGWFKLEIPESADRVTFSSVGFYPRQLKIKQLPLMVRLETKFYQWDKIVVTAERARPGLSPIAFDNYSGDEIARDFTVGDLPTLLNSTPNFYSFSDNGTNLGYSYTQIRGFDDKRIATYINGVPLNAWELTGQVIDSRSNPIWSASIVTDIPGVGGTSDESGYFYLSAAESSPNRITVSHIGYKPIMIDLAARQQGDPLVIILTESVIKRQGISVYANRAQADNTTIAFSDITTDQIERDYTVGDIPSALRSTPNLYTWYDAGAGLGYSHVSLRGFDEKRISVYVNGIPLNDPEDHVTYFIDLPDFTSSVRDIQVQRGVGSSLYADGTFGGSINIVTYALDQPRRYSLSTGIGAYDYNGDLIGEFSKQSLNYSSGLIDGRFHLTGRFSRQSSGGFVENSWYEGWSYFLSASRLDPKSTTTLTTYGGPIRSHAAWDGIDRDTWKLNPRANFLTYSGEGDNFNQPHYELHNSYQISDNTLLTNSAYYIRGKGYYEQFKQNRNPVEFNVDPALFADTTVTAIDVVVQQWVIKSQFGINSRISQNHNKGTHSYGLAAYYFESEHWGQVNSSSNVTSAFVPAERYYEYFGRKWNFSGFVDERYQLSDRLTAQTSLQLRYVTYDFRQTPLGAYPVGPNNKFDLDWLFLSPRIGMNYKLSDQHSLLASFSITSRTPTDGEIYDANDPSDSPNFDVNSERVYDYELGYRFNSNRITTVANLFYMNFHDEVVFWGTDDDGARLTDNAAGSFHSGVELSTDLTLTQKLKLSANFSYNYNRYREYSPLIANYGSGGVRPADYEDKVIPNFPKMIGAFIADYQNDRARLTYRFKAVGKQYLESQNIDSLAITGFGVSSLSGSYELYESVTFGKLTLSATVENLFDKLYLQSGYGGNFVLDGSPGSEVFGWAAYFPSAGRSFFVQLNLDFE